MAKNAVGLVLIGLGLMAISIAVSEAGRRLITEGMQAALAGPKR